MIIFLRAPADLYGLPDKHHGPAHRQRSLFDEPLCPGDRRTSPGYPTGIRQVFIRQDARFIKLHGEGENLRR